MNTHLQSNLLTPFRTYVLGKDVLAGFLRDKEIPKSTKLKFVSESYGAYDGCRVYRFKLGFFRKINIFIHEETSSEEFWEIFKECD